MKIEGQDGPSVLPDSPSAFRLTTPVDDRAFGGANARAMASLGADISKSAELAAKAINYRIGLYNETLAKEADVKASRALIDLQFNPDTGFMAKKGRNAVSSFQDTMKQAEEIRKNALDNLPNDQARNMFDQVFLRRLQYAQEGIGSHASRENLKWMNDTSKAREANLVSEGALNWNNLDRFNRVTIPSVVDEVRSRSELNGDSPETTQAEIRSAVDAAHVTRLKNMVNYDPAGAARQLGEVRKDLSAAGQIHAEDTVMHGIRLVHEQQMWEEHAVTKARQEQDEKIGQGFFTQLTNNSLTPTTIDKSALSTPQKIHWNSLVQAQARGEGKLQNNNPQVVQEVMRRIRLPYGNPLKITDINDVYGYVGEGVSLSAAGTLVHMVADQRTSDGQRMSEVRNRAFSNYRAQFVHDTNLGPDIQGGKDFFEFQQAVIAREDELRQKKEDPYQVYDTKSKYYIGNMVDQFKATFRERIQRQVDAVKNAGREVSGPITKPLPPEMMKKEGESINDWLKRTGSSGG